MSEAPSAAGVGALLAARRAGLESLGLVAGSSAVRFGFPVRGYARTRQPVRGSVRELKVQSQAWNRARKRVLDRLRADAHARGASTVVGVSLRRVEREWGTHVVELLALGTAVSSPDIQRPRRARDVALASLPAADVLKLLEAGWRPVDLAGGSTVVYVAAGAVDGGPWAVRSRERGDFTRGLDKARARVMELLQAEAEAVGAEGVVALELDRHVHPHEEEGRRDLVVTLHALATAIGPRGGHISRPELALELR